MERNTNHYPLSHVRVILPINETPYDYENECVTQPIFYDWEKIEQDQANAQNTKIPDSVDALVIDAVSKFKLRVV